MQTVCMADAAATGSVGALVGASTLGSVREVVEEAGGASHPWFVRIGERADAVALRSFSVHVEDADTGRDRALSARIAERYGIVLSWYATRTVRRMLAAAVPPATLRVTGATPGGGATRTVDLTPAALDVVDGV
ncbi:MAG: hypothetical protein HZA54_08970 [Planctomycetes bacterium]|nr:hypothetical protein [Planctomycetota bacterium]